VDPIFLSVEDVMRVHRDQISRYGGTYGVRSPDLLRSAVAVVAATFDEQFLHAELSEMAAAYLFHIVANHPFVDGNKRTGLASALIFLEINGVELDATEDDLVNLVMAVASRQSEKADVVAFFCSHALPQAESRPS
jgi:death on curing protein